MTKRIFRSLFGMSVVILLFTTLIISATTYEFFLSEQGKRLKEEGAYIVAGVENYGVEYLHTIKNSKDYISLYYINYIDYNNYGTTLNNDVVFSSNNNKVIDDYLNNIVSEQGIEGILDGKRENIIYLEKFKNETIIYAKLLNDDNKIVILGATFFSSYSLILDMAFPIIFLFSFVIMLSCIVSFLTAKNITNPINEIDLENPQNFEVYEELSPLIQKINRQNKQICDQFRDLKQQQQAFNTITSNMQEGLFVLNNKGDILSYNGGALEYMGIEPPKQQENIFVLNRGEVFRRTVNKVLDGKHHEEVMKYKEKVFNIFANPVWEDEEVVGVVLMLIDVTEKQKREDMRREFSANVSHELKTPLTSISGFAELMKSGMVKPEDTEKFAGKIYDETQRLISLVQDILNLSKLDDDSEEVKFYIEEEDINNIIKDVVDRLEVVAEKAKVSLKYTGATNIIKCNGRLIEEIIYNICDNAIKYNKANGSVRVTLKNRENEVVIIVKDTGIGINNNNQARIFERFYRVSQSRSKAVEGTGLGLSIVKHGVLFHNGRIDVESKKGKGTTISVYLPKG